MKIAFLIDDSLDTTDGVQQYVLTLGDWLNSNGHQVHFLVGETKRKDILNVHSMTKNIKVSFNKNKLSIPKLANKNKIEKILRAYNFDVIHVQMPYSPQFAGRVIKLASSKTKIISTFHIYPASSLVKTATKLLSLTARSSIKRIDKFICVSKPAQRFMLDTYGIKAQIIPNMINMTKINSKVNKNAMKKLNRNIRIVFLGRLVTRKGAEFLIKAFSQMKQNNIELIIGGKGSQEEFLKKLCHELNIEEKVQFMGFIAEEDKFSFLNQADISVFPSTGGESFGIVLLEAMAAGAGVVVGGDNPGYRYTLEDDNNVLVDPYDIDLFANKLDLLIENKDLYKSICKFQKDLVRNYDVNIVGPKIMDIYYGK